MPKTYSVNIYAHVEFFLKIEAETEEEAKEKAWDAVYEQTGKINLCNFETDDISVMED